MAREMRGVNALEGPELGALMAQAMQQRVRNNTTTAQRARSLRDMARGGPAGRAREDADIRALEEDEARFMERQRLAAEQWDALQMQERLASIGTERQPPMPNDPMNLAGGDTMWPAAPSQPQFQGQLGGTNAEEEALLAQMQADMANQPGAQGFTSEGYVPGGSEALPQATSVPQQPQVAGDTGTSQAQQPGPQGFTSPGYVQGEQAGAADTAGSAALQWLNELFKKDEQPPQTPQVTQGAGSNAGAQGFASPGYVSGGGQRPGESFQEFTQRQHQEKYPQQGMSPEEQQKLQQITQGLESSRPDSNADATVSWPTIGNQGQGAQTPGFQSSGYNPDVAQLPGETFMEYTQRMHQMRSQSGGGGANADEIIGSLLEKYGSQLKMAGYGEQLEKFASGNYTKADIDGLIGQFGSRLPKSILAQLQQASDSLASTEGAMVGKDMANVVAEEVPGLDPNYSGQQGTTSSGSSQFTTQHGFGAKDYNPEVAIGQNESFMDYTKRMHQRNQQRNAASWVDPDRP